MKDFKKYSIKRLVNKINRDGSVLQKRAIRVCKNLDLLNKPEFADDLLLVGSVVLDLCSWGFKEIEFVYITSHAENLISLLDSKYGTYANYKHTIYNNGDTIITFFYDDWKIILQVTETKLNLKKLLFTREYLIDNLAPNDRGQIVDLCRAGTPIGVAIKNSIKITFGEDHALSRLSALQLNDIRYDVLSPVFQFILISGIIIEQLWNAENQNWMLCKKTD